MHHVLELLAHTAARWPGAPSYCDEGHAYTWAETGAAVAAIGTALDILPGGVQRRPVALLADRGAAAVHAMLGTLAAGGFYIVLDPAQGESRLRDILSQVAPAALLADAAHMAQAKVLAGSAPVLGLEAALAAEPQPGRLAALQAAALDTDLAYLLFTSGSTGRPKGVAVTHRNLLAYSEWVVNTFAFGPGTVLGNQTPLYFSMSVTDLYGAMRGGACVQILPKRLFSFPVQLLDYLTARGVNAIYWVPSALGIVANWKALDYTALPPLRTVLFAGEVMPTAKLNYWRAHYPEALFANLYGPTETTDICAYYIVDRAFADDEPLPIGRPCENCGVLLLKPDGSCAAPGEEGELCVRGSFVAAGYYNQPDKTAERFTLNPAQPHYPERIYRTGDLARWNARGELMYGGRLDNQIKHRGYRIELGEIETAAAGQDKLDECACLYDAARDCLVLFYQGRRDLAQALRTRLAGRLPAYMQPAEYRRLNPMPHNPNGKIDRPALQALLSQTH